MRIHLAVLYFVGQILLQPAWANEGFWTFDQFPSQQVQQAYGFLPTPTWLSHVQQSSLRTPGWCSASFISERGLVVTNHHCIVECLEHLSTLGKNYLDEPFLATKQVEESSCPHVELDQLISISDVTGRIRSATSGLSGTELSDAKKAEITRIESACAPTASERCDVVELYRGGKYDLYKYKRYQDIRLVFAPEYAIGQFGGELDNFSFPRFGFDVALYRVYENGRPVDSSQNYLRWSSSGPRDGELTFVSGHPGVTNRLMTVSQLQFERDTRLIFGLTYYSEWFGLLTEFERKSLDAKSMSKPDLFLAGNVLKLLKGHIATISGKEFMDGKTKTEQELVDRVNHDRRLTDFRDAWSIIDTAVQKLRTVYYPYILVEGMPQRNPLGFQSRLAMMARMLIRAAEEQTKPNNDRLHEYNEVGLPALKQALFNAAQIHEELEIENLTFSLGKLREMLGVDNKFVIQLFQQKSPAELARQLIESSSLANLEVRQDLFNGGYEAIKASTDPMIVVMRDVVDPYARSVRASYEAEVQAPFAQGGEKIARALFTLHGANIYPDATGTLRLSFGQAKAQGSDVLDGSFFTTIRGAFVRETGRVPFLLPPSWHKAKALLNLDLPFNLVTTNEIVGGNSGSPLLNQDAEIVGVVFDSNLSGRASGYLYSAQDRTVAVDSACILEILSKIYSAHDLVSEIESANSRTK
ncbi:MAG: S46 family peptidase [Nitrospira sp.]|nr:S46 family peptidase [Nitrospira sp.]